MCQAPCQALGILWQAKPERLLAFLELMGHLQKSEEKLTKNHTNEHAIVNPDEGTGRGLYKTSTKKPCRLVGQEGFLRK